MSTERWTAPRAGWYRVMNMGEPEFLGVERPAEDTSAWPTRRVVRFEGTAADPVPCRVCRDAYDPNDPAAVAEHTEPLDCGGTCNRCKGRPSCYLCTSSFCKCHGH